MKRPKLSPEFQRITRTGSGGGGGQTMPPRRGTNKSSKGLSLKNFKKFLNISARWEELVSLLRDPKMLRTTAWLFIVLELAVNVLVIERIQYTEIDWKAYMQEVGGFLNGTTDYSKLRGDTGPLVYPAGFVYIFSLLHFVTSQGSNVRLAQYIFAGLYILLLLLVFRIYERSQAVPPYVLLLMCCTSYRIHSIFVLRLFNDPIAMIFLFASINAFLDDRWSLGSILYSCGVSVKMNILLFSPALLAAYLCVLGPLKTIAQLMLCGGVQLLLAIPFLLTDPLAYLKGAFDLGRVFEFRWTVNWRFLPESIFLSRYFHASLLVLHLVTLLLFYRRWVDRLRMYSVLKHLELELGRKLKSREKPQLSMLAQMLLMPLFSANLIGMAFSRSLHYQFYIWYYHSLPYIAWCCDYSAVLRIAILGVIELCWNTYPSTIYSSAALHACHFLLLYGLYKKRVGIDWLQKAD